MPLKGCAGHGREPAGRRIDEFVVAPGLPGAHRWQDHSDPEIVGEVWTVVEAS